MIAFTNAAQRTADWPAPADGARSWLLDSHTPWVFRGAAWHPLPLGSLGSATGPASQTDVGATVTTLVTLSVPVVAGRRYRIYGGGSGSQVTATAAVSYWQISDGDGGNTRVAQANQLLAGQALVGWGQATYAPAASKTAVITLQGFATASATRVSANTCQLSIDDIGA